MYSKTLRRTLFSLPDCLFDGDCWNEDDAGCECELFELDEGYCERNGSPERCPSEIKNAKAALVTAGCSIATIRH